MIKKEFNNQLVELLEAEVTTNGRVMDVQEKIKEIRNQLLKYEIEIDFDQSNKGNQWTDDELKVVLSLPPTKENCLKLAKAFKRGYGSIEQIYRWATTSDRDLKAKNRDEDTFVQQVRRIYKESGWRA